MTELPLQSLFTFRRLAPAVDYLGSPFSASFRPLLLGLPLRRPFRSPSLPFSSLSASFAFALSAVRSGYSALLFFLSAFFPFPPHSGLFGAPRFLSSPWFFPFRSAWFPIQPFRFRLLSFLLVSFRPSLLRSRSRSAGACLRSHSGIFRGFRFLSSASALGF